MSAAAMGAAPTFTKLTPTNPPADRRASNAALKPGGTGDLYLSYGGANTTGTLSELLSYQTQSNTWVTAPITLPSRERHALGYDPVHDVFAIVGGVTGTTVQDSVFLLDGASLAPMTPPLSGPMPTARADAAMHWVPSLLRFLYFGGRTGVMAATHVNDLWTLDVGDGGVSWALVPSAVAPAARGGVCSAWDPDHQTLLLFGGEASSMQDDTWSFALDGGGWSQLTVTGVVPSPRGFAGCAWEPRLKQLVLYGGQISGSPMGGLFSFDPVTRIWTSYAPVPNPGSLARTAAAYSPALGGIVFFGGSDTLTTYTHETWLLTFNQPPVVDAGADFSVGERLPASLSGSISDADGDLTTFTWLQTQGPAVALSGANSLNPTFTSPAVFVTTPLRFVLTGSDGRSSSSAGVSISVLNTINEPPSADAGVDFSVGAGALAVLEGGGTDPNGDAIVGFVWSQSAGPSVSLSSTTTPMPTFVAPPVLASTTLSFDLVVSDGSLSSSADQVIVTVAPTASDAGSDVDAGLGADGGSTDAGSTDAGSTDAGSTDGGSTDGGSTDGGSTDAGSTDAGSTDAGSTDAGSTDAGSTDAGSTDAGASDAGLVDGGGMADGGVGAPRTFVVGCACDQSPFPGWLWLGLVFAVARERK